MLTPICSSTALNLTKNKVVYGNSRHTWVYQKVPRLSSTDRKQMALGEYLRYD